MPFLESLILSLALSADAFSVAATVGLLHREPREVARLSFHFGLFQALLAAVGAFFGVIFLSLIADYDHWIVFVILTGLGLRMIYLAARGSEIRAATENLTKGLRMVALSLVVSIDALVAAIGLPATHLPLYSTIAMIGITAAVAAVLGMLLADHVRRWAGARTEIFAGVVLIAIGVATPLSHLGYL